MGGPALRKAPRASTRLASLLSTTAPRAHSSPVLVLQVLQVARRTRSLVLASAGLTSRSDRATPSGEHRAWRPAEGPSGAAPCSGRLAVTPERRRDAPVKREGSRAEQLQGATAADGRKRESSTARSSRCDLIKLNISLKLRFKQTSRSCRGARLGVCPAAPQGRLGGGRRTDDNTSEGSGGLARLR